MVHGCPDRQSKLETFRSFVPTLRLICPELHNSSRQSHQYLASPAPNNERIDQMKPVASKSLMVYPVAKRPAPRKSSGQKPASKSPMLLSQPPGLLVAVVAGTKLQDHGSSTCGGGIVMLSTCLSNVLGLVEFPSETRYQHSFATTAAIKLERVTYRFEGRYREKKTKEGGRNRVGRGQQYIPVCRMRLSISQLFLPNDGNVSGLWVWVDMSHRPNR